MTTNIDSIFVFPCLLNDMIINHIFRGQRFFMHFRSWKGLFRTFDGDLIFPSFLHSTHESWFLFRRSFSIIAHFDDTFLAIFVGIDAVSDFNYFFEVVLMKLVFGCVILLEIHVCNGGWLLISKLKSIGDGNWYCIGLDFKRMFSIFVGFALDETFTELPLNHASFIISFQLPF